MAGVGSVNGILGTEPIKSLDELARERAAAASNPNAQLSGAIDASRAQSAAAVGSAQSGVNAILAGRPAIDRAVGDMRNAANAMLPIADTMRGAGDALLQSGTRITDQALATLGTGLGFINMDASASPMVAEAIRLYKERDPDSLVASAAQDVQSQFDNASAQSERELARRGVSPTSGASLALKNLYNKALAVARASAMTRAREQGKDAQMSAFQGLIANNANTFLQTGGQLAQVGTSAQAQGVQAQQGAANVLGNAGNLFGNAGELGLNYDKTLMSAYNALAGIKLDQSKNTLSGENLRVSANNGGRGGALVSTNTGRHYGVGGELLETGSPKVDASLQMWRDSNK